MGYLFGNNYRVCIGKETALGSGKTNATSIAWSELTVLPDKCEMTRTVNPIETNAKTQTGLPTLCETKPGYQMNTVVLSGVLSHEHEIILKAFFKDASSPYTMDSVPALDGYVIMQVWSDDVATPYIADKAIGCQCVGLKLDGASGGLITYEATFTCIDYTRRDATVAITGVDPGITCTEGFNFGDVTATLNYGDTSHLKSFSLTLNNNAVSDDAIFQNSNQRLDTVLMGVTGEFNYVTNYYDSSVDKSGDDAIQVNTALTESLILTNTTKTWTVDLTGQVTDYQRADPDDQIFDNNVTERLVYDIDGGIYPVTITVASV